MYIEEQGEKGREDRNCCLHQSDQTVLLPNACLGDRSQCRRVKHPVCEEEEEKEAAVLAVVI